MDLATRDNALALLQELMSEEKRLSKLLTIKDESRELNQLVRTISENADRVEDRLKPFERREHRPSRNPADLPPGEVAARESMARVKHQLLAQSKGSEFELHLLLAEAESLNYAIHLARVAGENEPQSAAAEEYNNMSMRFKELYHRVLGMLRSRR